MCIIAIYQQNERVLILSFFSPFVRLFVCSFRFDGGSIELCSFRNDLLEAISHIDSWIFKNSNIQFEMHSQNNSRCDAIVRIIVIGYLNQIKLSKYFDRFGYSSNMTTNSKRKQIGIRNLYALKMLHANFWHFAKCLLQLLLHSFVVHSIVVRAHRTNCRNLNASTFTHVDTHTHTQ